MKVEKLFALAALAATTSLALAGGPAPAHKAVILEPIPGSPAKRVILTSKAAARLGIQTGAVSEDTIAHRQIVGGLVVAPVDSQAQENKQPAGLFGGYSQRTAAAPPAPVTAKTLPADADAWLLVTLSPAEWERLAKDRPARVLPLHTRAPFGAEILARPAGMPPLEDTKRSMLHVYYVLSGKSAGLQLNTRMRVELPVAGAEGKRKVVPYGAVYYDAKGAAWLYVNTARLTFERRRIAVERIAGDVALLAEGPPVGTPVVTVGAALLYGAEIFGK